VTMFKWRLIFRGFHFGLLPGEFQISWDMVGMGVYTGVLGRCFPRSGCWAKAEKREEMLSFEHMEKKKHGVQNAPYIRHFCCLGRNVPREEKRHV